MTEEEEKEEEGFLFGAWNKIKAGVKKIKSAVVRPKADIVDGKTFPEAFERARKAGKKTFTWNGDGKIYTTNYNGTPKEQMTTYGITNEQLHDRSWWQNRLARNLNPYSYKQPLKRFFQTVFMNQKDCDYGASKNGYDNNACRRDYFNVYNGLPQEHNTLSVSDWRPSITSGCSMPYYYKENALSEYFKNNVSKVLEKYDEMTDHQFVNKGNYTSCPSIKGEELMEKMLGHYDTNVNLGHFTVCIGQDKRGCYISYYDKWDLAPIAGVNTDFGNPYEIYDRIYFDPQTRQPINVVKPEMSREALRNIMVSDRVCVNNLPNSSTMVKRIATQTETEMDTGMRRVTLYKKDKQATM